MELPYVTTSLSTSDISGPLLRTLRSHNRLVGQVEGVDGIKTGYIRASGFNVVTSIQRGGRSIVAVVMGGSTARTRDEEMQALIAAYVPGAAFATLRRVTEEGGRAVSR